MARNFMGSTTAALACMLLALLLSGCTGGGGPGGGSGDLAGEGSGKELPAGTCLADQDCDDSSPCTIDLCLSGGECKNKPQAGGGCDDGNACTEKDTCDAAGACVGMAVTCPASEACQWSECDPAKGCVAHEADEGSPCDDGDPCTLDDACSKGECIPGSTKSCPDVNTADCFAPACNSKTGQCDLEKPVAEGAVCKDGNPCTKDDTCTSDGKCKGGAPVVCPDKPCWVGWCNEQTKEGSEPCTGDWKEGGVGCDDGDVCTTADQCSPAGDGMVCTGVPVPCDDDNPCTVESCEAGVGCSYETLADGAECAEGEGACFTKGTCQEGQCIGSGPKCYDENPCTDNVCDAQTGECYFVPNSNPCDDGDACTTGDVCEGGKCGASGSPCSGPCETGECTEVGIGQYVCTIAADGTSCDDGDEGTSWDLCADGVCTGYCGKGPATGAPCSESQDDCEAACGTTTLCDGTLKCTAGTCQVVPGSPIECPVSDKPCTVSVCSPETDTCVDKPGFEGEDCEDGYECTEGDTCVQGVCAAGAATCAADHQVLVLSPKLEAVAEQTGNCEQVHVPAVDGEALPALKPGDIIISQAEDNPVFCRVVTVAPEADGSLSIAGEVAPLEEAIPYGEFGYEGPASPELLGPGIGGDFEYIEGDEVYIPLPEVKIDSPVLPVGLKISNGYLKVFPWLTVKGATDKWLLKWIMFELSGSTSWGFDVTFMLKGVVSGDMIELKQQLWPPEGAPKPTKYFMIGPVPCSASLSLVGEFKFQMNAGIEPTLHVTGGRKFKFGLFWNPLTGKDPFGWTEGTGFDVTYEGKAVGAWGKLEIAAKPEVALKVGTVVGPTFAVGPLVKAEATWDAIQAILEVMVKLCLKADIGGTLEVFGKTLFKVEMTLIEACLPGLPDVWCFDQCLPGSDYCLNKTTRVTCVPDADPDECLDLKELSCAPNTSCVKGVCISDCTPKNCQQLGKECGNWDDGCGKQIPCGTCSGGNCVAGTCVPCKSDFCQNSGYSSGQYCKDASTLVTCGLDGVCKVEVDPPQTCTSGCANNKCNLDKCSGVQCPCKKCDPATGQCTQDPTKEGTSCGNGKTCVGGACICLSNFCQDGGYSSGTYCKDANTKVSCTTQGACKVETGETFCQNGCAGGSCKAGPTCGDAICDASGGETKCNCSGDCGACSGCCSGTDCLAGTAQSACGKSGNACAACAASQSCSNGSCSGCVPSNPKKTTECKFPEGDVYYKDDCGNWTQMAEDCVDCVCSGGGCQYVLFDHTNYYLDSFVWEDCKGNTIEDYTCKNYQFASCGCKYLSYPGDDAQLYHGNAPVSVAGSCADISIPGWHDGNPANGKNVRWTWTDSAAVPSGANPTAYTSDNARWSITAPTDAYYNIRLWIPGTSDLCNKTPDLKYAYDVYLGLVRSGDTGMIAGPFNLANYKNGEIVVFTKIWLKHGTHTLILYDHGKDVAAKWVFVGDVTLECNQ